MEWLLCDYGEVLALAPSAADRGALESEAGTGGPGFWAGYWQHRPAYDRADVDTGAGERGVKLALASNAPGSSTGSPGWPCSVPASSTATSE
jgi:hypothetical protein